MLSKWFDYLFVAIHAKLNAFSTIATVTSISRAPVALFSGMLQPMLRTTSPHGNGRSMWYEICVIITTRTSKCESRILCNVLRHCCFEYRRSIVAKASHPFDTRNGTIWVVQMKSHNECSAWYVSYQMEVFFFILALILTQGNLA